MIYAIGYVALIDLVVGVIGWLVVVDVVQSHAFDGVVLHVGNLLNVLLRCRHIHVFSLLVSCQRVHCLACFDCLTKGVVHWFLYFGYLAIRNYIDVVVCSFLPWHVTMLNVFIILDWSFDLRLAKILGCNSFNINFCIFSIWLSSVFRTISCTVVLFISSFRWFPGVVNWWRTCLRLCSTAYLI